MTGIIHASVLLHEVVESLALRPDAVIIDATVGLGGHADALLSSSSPGGRLLGVDRDPAAIEIASGRLAKYGSRVSLVEGNFSDLLVYAKASDLFPVDAIIADLGVSSLQLDDPSRGFSFMKRGPLDMRMGPNVGSSAAELLERFDVDQLTHVFRDFGELNRARELAKAVLEGRDSGALSSTHDLKDVIEAVLGGKRVGLVHPATRAFQAIRIAVNRELEELEKLLLLLPELVRPGGRAAIISFHSLEDRLVKHAFAEPRIEPLPRGLPIEEKKQGPWRVLTKKPMTPRDDEVRSNPRARSAKLRAVERR